MSVRGEGAWRALGRPLPIVGAPMAGVTTPALVAAVSAAGGLGMLAFGASTPEGAERDLAAVRAATDAPFGVNVFVHALPVRDEPRERAWLDLLAPTFRRLGATPPTALHEPYPTFEAEPAMLDLLCRARPAVVSFHFGIPCAETFARLRDAGCVLAGTATSVDEARALGSAGIDLVVAQGDEAGGHHGTFLPGGAMRATLDLVRAIVAETGATTIAAGGIVDGAGIAAALDAGAVAAQLGTAFACTDEGATAAVYRAALAGPQRATVVTRAISGRPARGLVSAFTALVPPGGELEATVPAYPVAYDAGKALLAAALAAGDPAFATPWAGTAWRRCRPMPARDLVATLARELEAAR